MSDKYNSKIAKFIGWINKSKSGYAVTITKNTTLYSIDKELVSTTWRKHEDCHKKQIANLGWFKFMFSYFYQSIKFGYTNNKFEIEARKESQL